MADRQSEGSFTDSAMAMNSSCEKSLEVADQRHLVLAEPTNDDHLAGRRGR
ncbi:MAG TPA: hypothetical protein VLA05_06215 [Coriobacteriia bacterium]|nr:hypothetical protein [Coriobacteriia bacterium]